RLFARPLRRGSRWQLLQSDGARAPKAQDPARFAARARRRDDRRLLLQTRRPARRAGDHPHLPAVPVAKHRPPRAACARTGSASSLPNVALSHPRAAGDRGLYLCVGCTAGLPRLCRGDRFGRIGALSGAGVRGPRVAVRCCAFECKGDIMKKLALFMLMLGLAVITFAQSAPKADEKKPAQQAPPSQSQKARPMPTEPAQVYHNQLRSLEREMVDAAEAMPDDKFDFKPDPKNGAFAESRTFKQQIGHVAANNFLFAAGLTGEKLEMTDKEREMGPASLTDKASTVKYL